MEDSENIFPDFSAQKLTNKSLLKLKRKQSQILRGQTTLLPAYEPPTLQLDDLIGQKPKLAPKIDKTTIKKILFEAGVDLSKSVTIGKQTYETVFNNDPIPIEKLKKHAAHNPPNFENKIDRKEFQKKTLANIRSKKQFLSTPQNRNPSRLSDLEREIWNTEQRQAEILNLNERFEKLYEERPISDKKLKQTMSFDLFEAENDSLFDEGEDTNKSSVDSDKCLKSIVKPIVSNVDFTQDIPNLCSGKFESQIMAHVSQSEPEDVISENSEIEENNDIEENDELEIIETDNKKAIEPISRVKNNKKLQIADFIEVEAEQSGSDVSLGTDGSDSEEGSLHEFILPNECSNSQNNEVKRVHVDEMLYEDDLQIEAIKNLHFPNKDKKISLGIENSDESEGSVIQFDITSQYKDEIIELSSEDDLEYNNNALSKMRLCLSKSTESTEKSIKNNAPNRAFLDDEDAMFPEYSSEQKTLLTMIKDITSKKNYEVSRFGSMQTKSFISITNSKKINHDLSNSFPHSNSTYVFMPTDSHNKQNKGTKLVESDDTSKLGSYKSASDPKTLPTGSIFSLLIENKNK